MTRLLLALIVLTQTGCVEVLALGVSAISSGVGIYQRKSARGAQDEQTEEIKALREEIARLRARIVPSPVLRAPAVGDR